MAGLRCNGKIVGWLLVLGLLAALTLGAPRGAFAAQPSTESVWISVRDRVVTVDLTLGATVTIGGQTVIIDQVGDDGWGNHEFLLTGGETYTATVTSPEEGPVHYEDFTVLEKPPTRQYVSFWLTKAVFEVVDGSSNPVLGAEVTVGNFSRTTGAGGICYVLLWDGAYSVVAVKEALVMSGSITVGLGGISAFPDAQWNDTYLWVMLPLLGDPQPAISVSGDATFGDVPVGTTVSHNFQVHNYGTADLHVTSDSVIGTGFSLIASSEGTIAPGAHNTLTVAFSPPAPGSYPGVLTIESDDPNQSTVNISLSGQGAEAPAGDGHITGGGWIRSPAGAYPPDPDLEGKARFRFNAQYKKDSTIPMGNTYFQYRVAQLSFQGISYEWLVVDAAKAQLKGLGTIREDGDYGFLLTIVDGALLGGGVDKLRMKIWRNEGAYEVVYDNQMGADDDAAPSRAIGGGSIVIHRAK